MKTMAGLVFLFSAIFFAVNAKEVCVMNQQTIMTDVEQCLSHHLGLDLTIMKHMDNPSSMMTPDFLCKYKSDIADVFQCMVVKLADCVPGKKEQLLAILPTKERMEETFEFICDHKDEMKNNCFNKNMGSFMQCYMKRIQTLSSMGLSSASDPQKILCSVVRSEEQCIEANKGTCSSDFISLLEQVLEKVFPVKACPKVSDSLLLRGEPLVFKSWNKDRGYAIQP